MVQREEDARGSHTLKCTLLSGNKKGKKEEE